MSLAMRLIIVALMSGGSIGSIAFVAGYLLGLHRMAEQIRRVKRDAWWAPETQPQKV